MKKMVRNIATGLGVCLALLLVVLLALRLKTRFTSSADLLQNLDNKLNQSEKIKHACVLIENGDASKQHTFNKGMENTHDFYYASVSKLFTHTLIFQLLDEGRLSADTSIAELVPAETWQGLLTIDGTDASKKITVRHLLDQTSGLPDYETDPIPGQTKLVERLMQEDFAITPQEAIDITKEMPGKWIPSDSKAYYSNLNAILLGEVAKTVTGQSLEELYQERICTPLGLQSVRVAGGNDEVQPISIGANEVNRNEYIRSAVAAGGLVGNTEDLMTFLKAFFQGNLFHSEHIESTSFHAIQFFPIRYGAGRMSVEMSFFLSPLFDAPQIEGHSGITSSFAFYCPSKELYIVGTFNQYEENPYPWIYQYLNAMK